MVTRLFEVFIHRNYLFIFLVDENRKSAWVKLRERDDAQQHNASDQKIFLILINVVQSVAYTNNQ